MPSFDRSRRITTSPADTPRVRRGAGSSSLLAWPQAFAGWLLVACLMLLAGPALAADWYASPNGAGTQDCTSAANACAGIQAAIDKAAAYDTVHVGAGDYAFTSNRIRIEKEGLRLVGENSPFAVDPATQPGTPDNKAADASVLKAPSAAAAAVGGITVNGMIWVRNVQNVRIENLYIEANASRSKEAIVAMGAVNGLQLVGNYIKITSGTSGVAIGVNVAGTTDSSVPTTEARVAGQFVTVENNVIEPGSSSVPKRAIALQNTVGLIKGNQVAATTQDMWIQSPTASGSNPAEQQHTQVRGQLVLRPTAAVSRERVGVVRAARDPQQPFHLSGQLQPGQPAGRRQQRARQRQRGAFAAHDEPAGCRDGH